MKHAQELFWHYWLPVLGMLSLITMESTDRMSGDHTFSLLRRVCFWFGLQLSDWNLALLNHAIRKCGHALGYGLLCFCWLLLLRGTYWLQHDYARRVQGRIHVRRMWWRPEWAWLAVLCTFVVASADELHQMNIPSRTGSWLDVALDTGAGVVVATIVWAKASWISRDEQAQS